ncbi:MAG: peptide chain release factor N(5)-glutamine methyltransferase [Clostridiales bacterium]|jgi:release factor glutamine methyltransferase|nr:peptide chain release factor N(5)-glutamine methyltransferase [Clostridiales bacterium]
MDTKQSLARLSQDLSLLGVEPAEAAREAKLILSALHNCSPAELFFYGERELDEAAQERIWKIMEIRTKRYPLQYILEETEFMSLTFEVNPAVLIPRGDTERLVELAIELMQPLEQPLLADIGCGSGCIAISLAHYLPRASLVATDISSKALAIAQKNAIRHNLAERIAFLEGDLLEPLLGANLRCHLIVSNPPYIPSADLAGLAPELHYEPRLALDGGPDGLAFYRRLIKTAPPALLPGGYLLLETGAEQKEAVSRLLSDSGFRIVQCIKDYGGNHRGVLGQFTIHNSQFTI